MAYVRDSILRTRLADPAYAGDETYMITEDKNGDPVPPQVNWKKPLPRKPNEDELRAIESLYNVNPVTGEKLIDWRQLNYKDRAMYVHLNRKLRRSLQRRSLPRLQRAEVQYQRTLPSILQSCAAVIR